MTDALSFLSEAPKNVVLDELERMDCEESLAYFLRKAWRWIDTAEYKHNWHIDFISEHAEALSRGECNRLLVNQPPRTMKTILLSVAFPAWVWAQSDLGPLSGPHVKFMFASYGQSLSFDHSKLCRNLIMSPWYQKHWGHRFKMLEDSNTVSMFGNDKGGYRIATSVGSGLTGRGADIIGVDDPHNTQDVISQAERESAINWWSQSLSTRLNDPKNGAFMVVMQRQHEDDLSGFITKNDTNGEWQHIMLPMRFDSLRKCVTSFGEDPRTFDGELLWSDRFGEKELQPLERLLGPYGVAGQLQQTPSPKGGGIFKRDWWQLWPPEGYDDSLRLQFPPMEYTCVSVDTAYTEKQENDYSACTMWGVWRDKGNLPRLMLMKAWQDKLEFHDLVEKIIETCRNKSGSPVDALLIEAKASGLSVAQEIQRLCGGEEFAVHKINPGSQDKVARAYSIQHLFSSGVVYAPDRKYADMVISSMEAFPKGRFKDLTDSATQALLFMRKIGLAVLAEEGAAAVAADYVFQPKGESIAENYGV